MAIIIEKRNGRKEVLDITKIQKMTIEATRDLYGDSQSELELDAQIKFIDGMSSSDIQDALIKTAVEKIDIDVPNWTFVAARLFLFDLYSIVGLSSFHHRVNSLSYHYENLYNGTVSFSTINFYELPIIPLKIIKLQPNSYVVNTNPILILLKNIFGNNSIESDNNK